MFNFFFKYFLSEKQNTIESIQEYEFIPEETMHQPLQPLPLLQFPRPLRSSLLRQPKTKVYVVIDKNSHTSLGVFDTFEKAKENGQKTTYHNCMIISFVLNDACKYISEPIFEN
jgi:hypothetical protein